MTSANHGSLWDLEEASVSFDKRGGENKRNISSVYYSTVHIVTHRLN